jgi:Signal transduction histidine kinase
MTRRLSLYILVLLGFSLSLSAQEKGVDILILSSHTESSEWAQTMLSPIEQLEKDRPELMVSLEHFRLLSHPSTKALKHAWDSVLTLHAEPPRLVVLLGGSCFNFAPDVAGRWKGVPLLLIGEQDYFCDIDYTLHGPGDPHAHRYPVNNLKNSGLNISLICAPPMVRRTVNLIFKVQPDLEKMFFIAGENYLSKERQWRLEQYMQEKHPDIAYRAISSADVTTDQLLSILQKESGPRTAVFYGSWLVREGYMENVSIRHKTVSLIENIAPLYTMFACDTEQHPGVMGFYSYSQREYGRTVTQRILDVLDHGIQPSEMPFVYLEAGLPTVNYQAMQHFGLDTSLIPEDALVRNKPGALWETYKKQIMLIVFLLLAALAGFVILTMSRSMRSMRMAQKKAENADKIKTAFVQNMSHEIRTPLNSIIGFSQILCLPEGCVTEEEKGEYLSHIMNNSQLLTMMVNDMLGIADMENGQFPVHKVATNLNEVMLQAIRTVSLNTPPEIEIACQTGLDEDTRYITDGMRIQQILINFLTNACKFTPRGQIVLGSSLVENPGYITFYVEDTGPGVPAEKAESIFDRFVKLDTHKQGAGLGLSVCRMVAENLGGKVWLDTRYTDGARFILAIPREEA